MDPDNSLRGPPPPATRDSTAIGSDFTFSSSTTHEHPHHQQYHDASASSRNTNATQFPHNNATHYSLYEASGNTQQSSDGTVATTATAAPSRWQSDQGIPGTSTTASSSSNNIDCGVASAAQHQQQQQERDNNNNNTITSHLTTTIETNKDNNNNHHHENNNYPSSQQQPFQLHHQQQQQSKAENESSLTAPPPTSTTCNGPPVINFLPVVLTNSVRSDSDVAGPHNQNPVNQGNDIVVVDSASFEKGTNAPNGWTLEASQHQQNVQQQQQRMMKFSVSMYSNNTEAAAEALTSPTHRERCFDEELSPSPHQSDSPAAAPPPLPAVDDDERVAGLQKDEEQPQEEVEEGANIDATGPVQEGEEEPTTSAPAPDNVRSATAALPSSSSSVKLVTFPRMRGVRDKSVRPDNKSTTTRAANAGEEQSANAGSNQPSSSSTNTVGILSVVSRKATSTDTTVTTTTLLSSTTLVTPSTSMQTTTTASRPSVATSDDSLASGGGKLRFISPAEAARHSMNRPTVPRYDQSSATTSSGGPEPEAPEYLDDAMN